MEESSDTNLNSPQRSDDSSLDFAVPEFPAPPSESTPPPTEKSKKRPRWFDLAFLIALVIASFSTVVLTGRSGYGLSWDEEYFYSPSRDAAHWLYRALFTKDRPLSRRDIDTAWSENKELPSVVKVCLGTSSLAFGGYIDELTALRIPSAAAYALTLAIMFLFMFRRYGRAAALLTVFTYALMPRIFGHAHIGAAETITALMTLLTVICFLKGLESARWSVILGIVFGLALNTKINCAFLPLILLPWAHIYHRKRYVNNFFAMVFLSPVVMVITWPWLWHDTVQRLLEYFHFYVSHQFTAVYYFGQRYNYGSTLAPWHYPFVMTVFTLPLAVLLFAMSGIIYALQNLRREPLPVLFLWGAFLTLVISTLPASPKYDGIRLFFPAFVFFAILCGAGFAGTLRRIPKGKPIRGAFYWRDAAAVLGIAFVLGNGALATIRSNTHSLSYFNCLIGGTRGAYNKGMETTYWGEAVNDNVLNVLNELPKGARIKTLALHNEVFNLLQRWGKLRNDLRFNSGPPPYDYHLLLLRKGFFARPEWCLFLTWQRLKVFEYKGVPLVILFKTGAEFERVWSEFPKERRMRNEERD